MKIPDGGAGAGVVAAGIPGRPDRNFADGGAEHDHVLIDGGSAAPADLDIDDAFLTEAGVELARVGVEGDQIVPGGEDNARRVLGIAGPVRYAARDGCYGKPGACQTPPYPFPDRAR